MNILVSSISLDCCYCHHLPFVFSRSGFFLFISLRLKGDANVSLGCYVSTSMTPPFFPFCRAHGNVLFIAVIWWPGKNWEKGRGLGKEEAPWLGENWIHSMMIYITMKKGCHPCKTYIRTSRACVKFLWFPIFYRFPSSLDMLIMK